MSTKEIVATVTFQDGTKCQHKMNLDDEQILEAVNNLVAELSKEMPGLYFLYGPFGVHKLANVVAVHYDGLDGSPIDASADGGTRPMGFISSLAAQKP